MKFALTLERIDEGTIPRSGLMLNLTTEAQVNQAIAGRDIIEDAAVLTEVQLRGMCHYFRAIATGLNTSSIETAVSAVI